MPAIAPTQRALANMRFARHFTDKLAAAFPENKATFQASPFDNHLAWTLGHLAISNAWFRSLIDGSKPDFPESYEALFGQKSSPRPDAKAYPALGELKKLYAAQFDALLAAFEKLGDGDLDAPIAGEPSDFARTKGDVADRVVWHEGWHGGQLSTLRRALGLPSVMG